VVLSTFVLQVVYPQAKITGLDLSPYLLAVANYRTKQRRLAQINWGRNSLIISTHNYPYITVCPSLQLIDQQNPSTVAAVLGTVLIFSLTPGKTLNCKGDLSYAT